MAITIRMITDYFVFILMEVFERQHDMRMKTPYKSAQKRPMQLRTGPDVSK